MERNKWYSGSDSSVTNLNLVLSLSRSRRMSSKPLPLSLTRCAIARTKASCPSETRSNHLSLLESFFLLGIGDWEREDLEEEDS